MKTSVNSSIFHISLKVEKEIDRNLRFFSKEINRLREENDRLKEKIKVSESMVKCFVMSS